jgi:hypothetical protein
MFAILLVAMGGGVLYLWSWSEAINDAEDAAFEQSEGCRPGSSVREGDTISCIDSRGCTVSASIFVWKKGRTYYETTCPTASARPGPAPGVKSAARPGGRQGSGGSPAATGRPR